MVGKRRPGVVFQPRTYDAMWRGVRQMVDVVRPTLGPVPRYVGVDRDGKNPELLDDAGLIMRRITALADPDEDMGAMYLRSLLWRMREDVGDGVATTAILFRAIFEGALRYLASGGNAMLLRRHLEAGLRDILEALAAQVIPVQDRTQIAGAALSLCHDRALAALLAEAVDTVGSQGRVEVRKGQGRDSSLELVPGSYWEGGLAPKQGTGESSLRRADLDDALILISDLELDDPQQLAALVPLIEFDKIGPLAIVAARFSEKTLSLFQFINRRMGKLHVVAIKAPEVTDLTARKNALDDLALLTGGRLFIGAAGDTFERLQPADFGRARQVWADHAFFGIVHGRGDPRAVMARIGELEARYRQQTEAADRQKTLLRLGQLRGGTVTILVGGATEREIDQRQEQVERAVSALRHALRDGMVPGGGIALLNCQPWLRERHLGADSDQAAAYTILHQALEAPLRTLVQNAGHDWSASAAQIRQAGAGYGCDTLSGAIVDMRAAGFWDIAHVTQEATRRAVSGVALLLTTDTLIHKRNPQQVLQPR